MTIAVDPPRKWWQPGTGEVLHRLHREQDHQGAGPRQPAGSRGRLRGVLTGSDVKPKDIDLLVTNQPNRVFLRNWRDAWDCRRERTATRSTSAATCSPSAFR